MLTLILSSIFADPCRSHTQRQYMDDYATQSYDKNQYTNYQQGPVPLQSFLKDQDVRTELRKRGINPNIQTISLKKKGYSEKSQPQSQEQCKGWMHTITDFLSTKSKSFFDWLASFFKKNADVQSTQKMNKKKKQKSHAHGKPYF